MAGSLAGLFAGLLLVGPSGAAAAGVARGHLDAVRACESYGAVAPAGNQALASAAVVAAAADARRAALSQQKWLPLAGALSSLRRMSDAMLTPAQRATAARDRATVEGACSALGLRSGTIRSPRGASDDQLDANTATAYEYFIAHTSLTPVQVAGLEGNLLYESGGALDPAQVQYGCSLPPGPCGVGIAQWTDPGPRFDALAALARSEAVAWSTLGVQLQFVWQELTGTMAGAGDALKSCTTTACSTQVVEDYYEIPAEPSASYGARLANANEILAAYQDIPLASPIATVPNADGRLETFAVGSNGQSYSSWQTSPNGNWTQWTPIGGSTPLPPTAALSTSVNADGRLQMFVVAANGRSYSSWQTSPNGAWTGWSPLGGGALPAGAPIAVAPNADGRLQMFAVAASGRSYSSWQVKPNGNWTQWSLLAGGKLPAGDSISVGRNADGRLEMFAVGANGRSYSSWQVKPNGNWTQWSPLGGGALPPGAPIAVAPNADGRLEMFAVGANGRSYSSWQVKPNGNWTQWSPLGGGALPPGAPISTGRNADGRLEMFALAGNDRAYTSWQTTPDGNWTTWSPIWGAPMPAAAPISVGSNADGRLQIFVVAADGLSNSSWQTGTQGTWTAWALLGGMA